MNDLNNKIIISPNSINRIFLSIRNKNPRLNFTIFDLPTLQKALFGDYNFSAINYLLSHTSYSLKDIKCFLNYISRGVNTEINDDIKKIYDLLIQNNLLTKDDLIKNLFKQYDVIIVGYCQENIELQNVLKILNVTNYQYLKIEDLIDTKKPQLLKFKNYDEEIRYVLNLIINEQNEDNNNHHKKYIVCEEDYFNILKIYASSYNVKLYFKNEYSLINTRLGKHLLDRCLDKNIDDPFLILDDLYKDYGGEEFIDNLKNNINQYLVKEVIDGKKIYVDSLYESLKTLMSSMYLNSPHYENEIIVTSKIDINPNIDYYLVGASDKFLPTLYKNNEMFDDSLLEKNNINNSRIKNIEVDELSNAFVKFKNVVHMSYSSTKGKDVVFNTTYVNQIIIPKNLDYDYSLDVIKAYYSKAIDIQKKYNENSFDLNYESILKDNNYFIDEYDSSFNMTGNEKMNKSTTLSYSSIDQFSHCPFKYYIEHVLHLSSFEENFNANLGTFAHHIFEYIDQLDFEEAYQKACSFDIYQKFNAEELIIIDSLYSKMKYAYEKLKNNIYVNNVVSKSYHEYQNFYKIDDGLFIKGTIDNLVQFDNGKLLILDYKTKKIDKLSVSEKEKLSQGMNLQLPMYATFISLNENFNQDDLLGLYFYPLINDEFDQNSEEYSESFRLKGYTFDKTHIENKFISSVRYNYPLDELLDITINHIKLIKQEIDNVSFKVNPKITLDPNTCKYCSYSNICFKKFAKKDRPNLEEEENEERNGEEDGE
ncbi:MAG: PD-(D/E)XK nuclease family protein [Bacillales bacterium]|nr:PD-(D/E)XK nuclease family protein [Bacillales bacterium]